MSNKMYIAKYKQEETTKTSRHHFLCRTALTRAAFASGIILCGAKVALAATQQLGDVTVTLQSTIEYTLGERTAPVDSAMYPSSDPLTSNNTDDGDRNFRYGIMENRIQALEQLGIVDGNYGLRASALTFLDGVYLQNNKNNSPSTFNAFDVGNQGFASGTVANVGRKFEPLAIFVFGSENFGNGNQKLSWQVGRQTITWGESLFSLNGIAGLQAPVDAYIGQSEPNPQAQALFLPTGAASVAYDFGNGITVDAYWQFEYEPDIVPSAGSYFSPADFVGPGAQRIIFSPVENGIAESVYRGPDIRPSNGLDQFGFASHDTLGNFEVGAYFVRGISKVPNVYLNAPAFFAPHPAGLEVGQYQLAYAQPTNAYAISASTLLFGANVAGELSGRTNQPFMSGLSPYTSANPANYSNPLYASGNVINLDLSEIYLSSPLPLMPNGAQFISEFTFNDVVGAIKNEANEAAGSTREGAAFEAVFMPNWYPRSNVEVDMPVGWTAAIVGDPLYNNLGTKISTNAGTGTIDVGLKAIYKANLTVGVNYQRYYGSPNQQALLDRDFATVYIQKTF